MDERTSGALILAVGGVAIRLGVTDAALNYIRPSYTPLLAVAGVLLALLGTWVLVRALRGEGVHAGGQEDAAPLAEAHAHAGEAAPRIAWALALPLFAILLIAPPPLGAFAASRQSGAVTTDQTSYAPLAEPVEGAVELTLGEYAVRALYDTGRSLRGVRVRLVGFVSEQGSDTLTLTRFGIACCAADGTAVNVEVRGAAAAYPVEQWVEVEGEWLPREGHTIGELTMDPPILVADEVTPIAQPEEPYEY